MIKPLPLPIFAWFLTATFFCGGAPWSAPVAAATPNAATATTKSTPITATLLGERFNQNFIFRSSLIGGRRENETAGRWSPLDAYASGIADLGIALLPDG